MTLPPCRSQEPATAKPTKGLPVPLGPEITIEEGIGTPEGRSESNQPRPVKKLEMPLLRCSYCSPTELLPPASGSNGFIFLLLSTVKALPLLFLPIRQLVGHRGKRSLEAAQNPLQDNPFPPW